MSRSSQQTLTDSPGDGLPLPGRDPGYHSHLASCLEAHCPEVLPGDRVRWAGQLQEYADALQRGASRLSLVSRGDRLHVIRRHILPALRLRAAVRVVPHRRLLDLGSGAGLPGIPLKITLPDAVIFLVESRRRRANFLRQVVRQLQLQDTYVIHERLEDWQCPSGGVDVIFSRAVKLGHELVASVDRCLAPHGALLTTVGPGLTANSGARMMVRQQLGQGDTQVRCALWRA